MTIDVYAEDFTGDAKREKVATFIVGGIEDVAINDVS